jgi:hypothetical protein
MKEHDGHGDLHGSDERNTIRSRENVGCIAMCAIQL